ncbi:kinase-like domain-containing protein [Mycena metata]|uniref:Kinase-like domain-containing protein n=1 Tax=Mycena metata TaxID=1033252 RepID=A0AAD7K5C0_9AGAR|nr:kinase-like domain-containing protein [Mycena metata]
MWCRDSRVSIRVVSTSFAFTTAHSQTEIPTEASEVEVATLQETLDDYSVSMSSDSVVEALASSPAHRKALLEVRFNPSAVQLRLIPAQLSSELNLGDDPGLRTALRADDERIAAHILPILDSKEAQYRVLNLDPESAQSFLDVIQDVLDRGFFTTREQSHQARRMIGRLAELCDRLPTSLFISGVTERDEHPTFAGGFGDVYRASYNNKPVALKHVRHFLQNSDSEIRRIRLKLCQEALVWRDLRHPQILSFIGIDRESFPSSLCLVSPWMEHGNILRYLKHHGHANVDKLLYQVAQGLEYLHSQNIVHGDLRGTNILITKDWTACLTDFGLSGFSDATASTSTGRRGSLYWMAPELLSPDRFGLKFIRTPATDVYAFGCLCLELYTGRAPFSHLPEPAAMMKIINGERPELRSGPPPMPVILWEHVSEYWAESPISRPVTEVVVKHMLFLALKPYSVTPSQQLLPLSVKPLFAASPDYSRLGTMLHRVFQASATTAIKPDEWDGIYFEVLSAQDPTLFRELVSHTNLDLIMPLNGPALVSQPVILALVHRLSTFISRTPPAGGAFKDAVRWLQRASALLRPEVCFLDRHHLP